MTFPWHFTGYSGYLYFTEEPLFFFIYSEVIILVFFAFWSRVKARDTWMFLDIVK